MDEQNTGIIHQTPESTFDIILIYVVRLRCPKTQEREDIVAEVCIFCGRGNNLVRKDYGGDVSTFTPYTKELMHSWCYHRRVTLPGVLTVLSGISMFTPNPAISYSAFALSIVFCGIFSYNAYFK